MVVSILGKTINYICYFGFKICHFKIKLISNILYYVGCAAFVPNFKKSDNKMRGPVTNRPTDRPDKQTKCRIVELKQKPHNELLEIDHSGTYLKKVNILL